MSFEKNTLDGARALNLATQTLEIETAALTDLKMRLLNEDASPFQDATSFLLDCKGRVVVSGIGKSGHVARKIAATFASTGTPAMFVHPAEALHGDLGMITQNDILIAISYSGEAQELLSICPLIKRMGAKIIAFTGNPTSGLAKVADVHLNIHVEKEACPLNLAPTASTTTTLALGDALAVAVLDAKRFTKDDFAKTHPGGQLGRQLLTHVGDIMRKGEEVPYVTQDTLLRDALFEMTKKGIAMTAIIDENHRAIGVFTDGDLRRLLEKRQDFTSIVISEVMSKNPRTITPEKLATEAMNIMETYRINQLLVSDENDRLIGAIHIHDLTNAKVM